MPEERTLPFLLVEDDDTVRSSLQLLLGYRGLRVVTAQNGKDALARLQEHGGARLILLDWMMPVMSGARFLAELAKRPRFADTPVLVFTAFADMADDVPEGHVRKPVDSLGLIAAIRERFPELLPDAAAT